MQAYIKSLSQKTAQHKKSVNFEDVGEITISSELDTHSSTNRQKPSPSSGSKFLKQNTSQKLVPLPQSKFLKKPQASAASPVPTVSSQPRPSTSRGQQQQPKGPAYGKSKGPDFSQLKGPSYGQSKGAAYGQPKGVTFGQPIVGAQKSSSLDKAAALTQKIAQKQTFNARNMLTLETDSDDTFTTPRARTPGPGQKPNNRVLSPSPRSVSSDSVKIGRDGGKFMKKKHPAEGVKSVPPQPESSGQKSPVPRIKQKAGSEQKKSGRNALKRYYNIVCPHVKMLMAALACNVT